jgi:hypothetical protein
MSQGTTNSDMQRAIEKAQAVKETYQDELMAKENVVGVGVGFCHKGGIRTDTVGLVVMVSKKMHRTQLEPGALIPQLIDGVPVDVQEIGQIRAQ